MVDHKLQLSQLYGEERESLMGMWAVDLGHIDSTA
jgi:hypothetical protein